MVLVVFLIFVLASLPFVVFGPQGLIGKVLRLSSGVMFVYAVMALNYQIEHGSGKRPFGLLSVSFLMILGMVFLSQTFVRKGVPLIETTLGLAAFFFTRDSLGEMYAGLVSIAAVTISYALVTRFKPLVPVVDR